MIREVMAYTDKFNDPIELEKGVIEGTFDMLNKEQSSAFVALSMNWKYNFSKYIINEIKGKLKGSKSKRFMMYPIF
ncbi:hypothetical protein R6Q57_005717 [Mikania cordata]